MTDTVRKPGMKEVPLSEEKHDHSRPSGSRKLSVPVTADPSAC